MDKRKIINLDHLKFEPFDRYGKKINYGTYISKLDPETKTPPHIHTGHEEFLILKGELIDSDGTVFKKGNFISYEPNSSHSSYTKKGYLI